MLSGTRVRFRLRRQSLLRPGSHHSADTRHSYGEARYQLTGKIEQRLFVVVYTPKHGAMRIISARKANQREVKHYEDSTREN